jgi:ATP-dependent Clp protease ATP-binding subunit ClpC
MFERFTERARNVVVVAQDEARALRHNFIGTEHILLGLLCQQDGLAAHVLTTLGIGVEAMRAQVARIVGTGDEPTSGQIPFTPRAKNVLERALEEALALGHNYVGSEHILLGLVREKNGVGARILRDSGLRADTIRDEVIRSLSTATPRRASVGGFAPAFALADLAAAIEDAKRSLIEKQAFDEAAELRDQQRRLHETCERSRRACLG